MKSPVRRLIEKALVCHETGRLGQAEAVYSAVLEREPRNADAWHLLGRVSFERGDWKSAAARVLQAIRQQPAVPAFHSSLGEILAAQGRTWDASLCYQEALRLSPGYLPALVNLGNALQTQGRYREACVVYWRAIQAQPDCAEAFSNLGNALRAEGRTDEAKACYLEALRLRPDDPAAAVNLSAAHLHQGNQREAEEWARQALAQSPGLVQGLSNLSVALLNQHRYAEAEQAAREALAGDPAAVHLHSNLASVLLQQNKLREAEAACRHALGLQPDNIEAANNLGVALQFQDRFDEAATQFANVLRSRPGYADAWTNLGTVRQAQGRNAESLACFEEALRHDPAHAKSHFCHSLSLLLAGRLPEGFDEYEWRWKVLSGMPRAWCGPPWDGSLLDGRTILLYGEQGLGDTIQFARYAPLVAARGGRVIVECQAPLAPLIGSIEGVARVITPESDLPRFDVQAALMSLPRLLATALDGIPARVPYMQAGQALVEHQRAGLGPPAGFRAGLVWQGNPGHANDRKRSLPLALLEPLAEMPGVDWYSLQAGENARADTRQAGGWIQDILPEPCRVEDLAAAIRCMDLVISVDTMPAHLAGALGHPVWTLLPFSPDWRWLEQREDTPWYPTMRLLRQPRPGDWDSVVERVRARLRNILSKASAGKADERE